MTIYAAQVAAVLVAAVGAVGASLGFVLLALVAGVSASWYARRRHVDFGALALADRTLYLRVQAFSFLLVAAWCGAIAVYGVTKRPLVELPTLDPSGLRGAMTGAAVGGLIGGLAGGAWQWVASHRAVRDHDALEPDDEF